MPEAYICKDHGFLFRPSPFQKKRAAYVENPVLISYKTIVATPDIELSLRYLYIYHFITQSYQRVEGGIRSRLEEPMMLSYLR